MTETKIKPSQFLQTLEPWTVYDHHELSMDWAKEVGPPVPAWPTHSAKRAQAEIYTATVMENGVGGWMDTSEPLAAVAYGHEIAEAVAGIQAAVGSRHERFKAAVVALEADGR